MIRSLSYLVDAVREDLGPIADAFPAGFFERALNEGQRRYEPQVLRRRVLPNVTFAVDDTSYTLPDDFYGNIDFVPTQDYRRVCYPTYTMADGVLYFGWPVKRVWQGTLFYDAHYPEITESQDCILPDVAADGLISFALYRAFRRLAAGRAEYRRYATIVGNAVAMSDLEQAASIHLQDYEDARISGDVLQEPVQAYEGE